MKRRSVNHLFIILVVALVPALSYSQEKPSVRPGMALQYVRLNSKTSLRAKLTYPGEKGDVALPGMQVGFFEGGDLRLLDSAVTDANGTAVCNLDSLVKLRVDQNGAWRFSSVFKGKDSLDAANAEIEIREMILGMNLSVVDTVRTVNISAFIPDGRKKIPVSGEIVKIFVPRMFSNLPVADAKLDETGAARVEFPGDIPGDKDGNLIIAAAFFEHPVFGTVEYQTIEKWGVPTSNPTPVIHRALWTKTPPMWMIVTLSILLTGVWGHYMFAVISLILIWLDARRKKARDEYRL